MLKFYSCFLIATLAVVAVSSYDFKDADFNKFLFEELEAELEDSEIVAAPIARHRRDVMDAMTAAAAAPASIGSEMAQGAQPPTAKKECSRRDYKEKYMCCQGDKFDQKLYEPYMEAKKQCYAEVRGNNAEDAYDPFDCEKMTKAKEQMVCVNECFAKKLNFLADDGSLKRDTLLALVRKMIGDVQWKQDASETIVDKCLAEVKTKREVALKEASTTATTTTTGCNRCPLNFHYCLWREFSNGCPPDLRIDTPKCNKIRERLIKGDKSVVNKHFLHFFHEKRQEEEVKA